MCGGHFNPLLSALVMSQVSPAVREPALSQTTRGGLTCWNCKRPVNADFTWCPTCSSALKPVECSFCGKLIGIHEDDCPHCGAPKRVKGSA